MVRTNYNRIITLSITTCFGIATDLSPKSLDHAADTLCQSVLGVRNPICVLAFIFLRTPLSLSGDHFVSLTTLTIIQIRLCESTL